MIATFMREPSVQVPCGGLYSPDGIGAMARENDVRAPENRV